MELNAASFVVMYKYWALVYTVSEGVFYSECSSYQCNHLTGRKKIFVIYQNFLESYLSRVLINKTNTYTNKNKIRKIFNFAQECSTLCLGLQRVLLDDNHKRCSCFLPPSLLRLPFEPVCLFVSQFQDFLGKLVMKIFFTISSLSDQPKLWTEPTNIGHRCNPRGIFGVTSVM